MKRDAARYRGYRFPAEIISYTIWVYHRFCISFRDVEDLLAQRGVIVSYETNAVGAESSVPIMLGI